jgi:hypothetical protein
MKHTRNAILDKPWKLTAWFLLATLSTGFAQTSYITGFGDGVLGLDGWKSDDTRNSSGLNLIGGNNTHAAVGPAVAGHDELIGAQLDWVTDFLGTRGNLGGLRFDGTASGSGKSTISVIDTASSSGLGLAGLLDDSAFSLSYRWRKEDNLAAAGVSVKIGIQSANWGSSTGQSQFSFNPARSGETVWDLVLVYDPTNNYPGGVSTFQQGTFYSQSITATSGRWFLFDQASNSYFDNNIAPIPGNSNPPNSGQTLSQWLSDPTWGPIIAGGRITNTQFGVGSGNANTTVTLDAAQVSYLNGGKIIDFVDAARWTGATSNDFIDSANWSDSQAPNAARNAVIDKGAGTLVTLTLGPGSAANVRSLGAGSGTVAINLGNGASLTANGNGFISAEVDSTLSLSGGVLSAAAVEAWGAVQLENTIVSLDGGSVNQPVRGGRYGIVIGPGGTLTLGDGAEVTVANPSAGTVVRVGEGFGDIALLEVEPGSSLKVGTASQLGAFQVGDFGSKGEVVQTGGLVEIIGSLNIGNRSSALGASQGTYNLSGGTLRLSGGLYALGRTVNGDAFAASGQMNISGGVLEIADGGFIIGDRDTTGLQGTGTINQTGGVMRVGEDGLLHLAGFGGGTYNLSGGTLEVGGDSLRPNYNSSAPYAFNLGGGTIKVIGSDLTTNASMTTVAGTASTIDTSGLNAVVQGSVTGSGSLIKGGEGTLTIEQDSALASLTIQAGILLAQGEIEATGDVRVAADATFAGTGSGSLVVKPTGKLGGVGLIDIPALVEGTIDPGLSPGLLTVGADMSLASGSRYLWELADDTSSLPGVNFDQLKITDGAFTIASGVSLELSFAPAVDFAGTFWDSSHSWTIIDAAGASSFSYSELALTNGFNPEGEFVVGQTGEGVSLNWEPVPEPSSALVMAAASLLVFNRRRRKR